MNAELNASIGAWKKPPRPKGNYKAGCWFCWKCQAHIRHNQKEKHKKECGKLGK
jgi:hypothetical protein